MDVEGIKVIYIMGYGRSGSTVLSTILGSHPDVASLGELVLLYHRWSEGDTCACSRTYDRCPFWSRVREAHARAVAPERVDELTSYSLRVEKLSSMPLLILSLLPRKTLSGYRKHMHALFLSLSDISRKRILVDSSKSVPKILGRVLGMKKICGFDMGIIHLVRDGRGVMYSRLKCRNEMEETHGKLGPYRACLNWLTTNFLSKLLGIAYFRGKVLRVNYEDFVMEPARELRRIGSFFDIDFDGTINDLEQGRDFMVGHVTGGNRVRKMGAIKLKKDFEWHEKLPLQHRVIFNTFVWPLSKLFGFGPPVRPVKKTSG